MKYHYLRGLIIEGMSHAGKTSLFNAVKLYHADRNERTVIALSEHYTQVLHNRNGELYRSSRDEHAALLKSRMDMLVALGEWGNGLGSASREARGVFFMFERFHLNHAHAFPDSDVSHLESTLLACNAKTVLLTVPKDVVVERIHNRNTILSQEELAHEASEFLKGQECLIALSRASHVPTMVVDTGDMNWNRIAQKVLEFVD